jgi:AraC-like DNA-binding protein
LERAPNTNADSGNTLPTATLRVSSILVCALIDAARQCGVSPDTLLSPAGQAALTPDRDVCLEEFQALFARAITLTGRPALGLLAGTNAREHSFEVLGHLVSHARTMRHAIALCGQYHPLAIDGGSLTLTERAGRARLECEFPRYDALLDRGLAEFGISGMYRMLLVYGGVPADVFAVSFTHTRPAYCDAYTAVFGGTERFGQQFTGLDFDARVLDLPHLHASPELHEFLRMQAERKLGELSRPQTIAERLRAILRSTSKPCAFTMPDAARRLGMSVRSLRRRLDEEGASFRDLLDAARRDAAYWMLRDPDVTIQAASFQLGFASPSVFHRAFKRWTGMTPAQFREHNVSA